PWPLVPVLITASVPLIGRYLQDSSAANQAAADQRQRDLQTASATLGQVSGTLNRLLHAMLEAMWGSVFDRCGNQDWLDDDAEAWKSYRKAATDWRESRVLHQANVESYFGMGAAKLLQEIDQQTAILGRQIEAAHFKRTSSQYFIADGGEHD